MQQERCGRDEEQKHQALKRGRTEAAEGWRRRPAAAAAATGSEQRTRLRCRLRLAVVLMLGMGVPAAQRCNKQHGWAVWTVEPVAGRRRPLYSILTTPRGPPTRRVSRRREAVLPVLRPRERGPAGPDDTGNIVKMWDAARSGRLALTVRHERHE